MEPSQTRSSQVRRAVIVGCLLLLVGALIIGRGTTSNSVRSRTDRIASDIKCPTCQGLSVKQSSAGPAKAIYAEIQRQVTEGQTDADIRGYLVSRFGTEQLLRPEATGVTSVVWIAPVVFGVLALAFLLLAFARWRPKAVQPLSAADEALVAAFRSSRGTSQGTSQGTSRGPSPGASPVDSGNP